MKFLKALAHTYITTKSIKKGLKTLLYFSPNILLNKAMMHTLFKDIYILIEHCRKFLVIKIHSSI